MHTPLYNYRRRLPHYQKPGVPLFVTFRKVHGLLFSDDDRDAVFACCLAGDEIKFELHAVVVMLDHVHLLLTPLPDDKGWPFSLHTILKAIKGASARAINKNTGRIGSVWQDESFDHVLRNDESIREKIDYIRQNPVRKWLVSRPEDYRWLYVQTGWFSEK